MDDSRMTDKKNIVIKVKYPISGVRAGEPVSAPKMITEWNIRRIAFAAGILMLMIASPLYFFNGEPQITELQSPVQPPEKAVAVAPATEIAARPANSPEKQEPLHKKTETAEEASLPLPKPPEAGKAASHEVTRETGADARQQPEAAKAGKNQPSSIGKKDLTNDIRHKSVSRALLAGKIVNNEPAGIITPPVKVSKSKAVWVYYFTELKGMKGRAIYHEWLKEGKVVSRQKLNISAPRWRTFSGKPFNHTAHGQWSVRLLDDNGQILNEKRFNIKLTK